MTTAASTGILCSSNCYEINMQLSKWLSTLNYSATAIPQKSTPLEVFTYFTLIKIISLENTGILKTMGMIQLLWNDNRLQWNSSNYNNLTWFETRVSKVWSPSLTLFNPAGTPVNFPINKDITWINPDGTLTGIINSQFITACDVDLRLFPYDVQTCYMDFGVVEYWTAILNFRVNTSNVSREFYLPSQDWSLQDEFLSVRQVWFYDDWYSVLRVTLVLKRDSFYYVVSLVFPVVLLQLLLLLVFILPQGSALKVTLAASLVLTMYILQKDSAKMLPSFEGTKYPMIILGLCAGMGLGAVVLFNSVLSVILCQINFRMPYWLWRALLMPPRNKVTPAGQNGNQKSQHQQDVLELIKMRLALQKRSAAENLTVADVKDENNVNTNSEQKHDNSRFGFADLIALKLEKMEERRMGAFLEQEKKQNLQAWGRLELVVNVTLAIGYVVASLYYVIVCLTQ